MAKKYDFTVIDASQPADEIFAELQRRISDLAVARTCATLAIAAPAGRPRVNGGA